MTAASKRSNLAQAELWLLAIRDRLERGPATTEELAEVCGCEVRGPLGPFLYEQLKAGTLAVTPATPHSVWSLSK